MILLFAALVCADCHREIVERFARTPMANSSGVVRPAEEAPGLIARHRMRIEAGGSLRLEWPKGAVDLVFFIGSRRMGRSFAFQQDGRLYQAPAGYYANRGAWDSPPGYERDATPDFSRPITAECLFCHATRARLSSGAVNRYDEIGHGIQCERCHGSPAEHEKLVSPGKLAPRLRDSVCEQCHLAGEVRLVQPGKRMEDFGPGQDLAEYVEVFTGVSGGVKVNGHAEALAASRCKQASGNRLWCGTCHNPHSTQANYNAVCRSCHAQPHNPGDCAGCHMPKARASDGGHSVFTDHSISTRQRTAALASYFGRQPSPRNLGLAYARLGVRQRDPEYLEKAWPLLRQAASVQQPDPLLYSTIAGLLQAGGRKEQAILYYRLSLEQDPLQPDVMRKLADLLGPGEEAQRWRRKAAAILPPLRN
ncbi:MAG: hypothetical protein HY235_17810 [Acidobacteria bacterium]|nr:hypothetical protein [Acidobacteriota bacterium]